MFDPPVFVHTLEGIMKPSRDRDGAFVFVFRLAFLNDERVIMKGIVLSRICSMEFETTSKKFIRISYGSKL